MGVNALNEIARVHAIKEQVTASLEQARAALAAVPGDIAQARVSLAEARGAFVIVQLKALARFVEELEDLLTDIDDGRAQTGAAPAMVASIQALQRFVDALAHGGAYQPLSLFPLYGQLCALRGRPGVELDLYYPELVGEIDFPAATDAPTVMPTERRSRFQAGLLRFLKGDPSGTAQMQQALAGVDALATNPTQRLFWWVAQALLDALAGAALEVAPGLKRLCGRVDLELRQLCEASRRVSEPVMREMLYHLAQAAPVTERVRQVQDAYALTGSLIYEPLVAQAPSAPDLAPLRAAVHAAQAAWERSVGGDAQALSEVCEWIAKLNEHSDTLSESLRELARALQFLCEHARSGTHGSDPTLSQDIVNALLLAELLLTEAVPAARYASDAEAIVQRAARRRDGEAVTEATTLAPSLIGAAEHRRAAAVELNKLLKSIEQSVEAAFAEPAQRAVLLQHEDTFAQLVGALVLLAPTIVEEVNDCRDQVRALARSDAPPAAHTWTAAAESLAALADRIAMIGVAGSETVPDSDDAQEQDAGEESDILAAPTVMAEPAIDTPALPDVIVLEVSLGAWPQFLDTVSVDEVAIEPAPEQASPLPEVAVDEPSIAQQPAAAVVPSPVAPQLSEEDQELRQIFLEEATEVLASIGVNVQALHIDSDQRSPLIELRRSFHTLKGSSRMAGLPAFGDAAFCAEKLLNGWIEGAQPVSPELLRFVEQAANTFTQWVAHLQAGTDTIDPASVYAAADLLQPGIAPASAKPLEPQASAVVTTVTIGTVVLSAELYQIFLGEAQRHVSTLTQQADVLKHDPASGMPEEFLRAAHTLGGIAGTAQMPPLSELGYALEALLQRMQSRRTADLMVVELLTRAIAHAAEMVNAIAQRQAPVVNESLTRAVQSALTEGPPDDPSNGLESCTEGDSSHGETQTLAAHEHAQSDAALTLLRGAPDVARALDSEPSFTTLFDGAVTHLQQTPAELLPSDDLGVTLIRELPYAVPEIDREPSSITLFDAPAITQFLQTPTQLLSTTMATSFGTLSATMTARTIPPVSVEQPAPPERRRDRIGDDIDAELLPVFLDEAQGFTPEVASCLRQLRADARDVEAARSLKRALHTLKGSARMAGAMVAGELAHSMETRVEALEISGGLAESLDELQSTFDRFGVMLDELRQAPVQTQVEPAMHNPDEKLKDTARAVLRVRADVVDRLVNQAGEVSVARSRIEGEVRTLRGALLDLTDNVIRLRSQLRDIEIQAETQLQSSVSRDAEGRFDPLEFDRFTRFQELTRGMAESVNDVATLQQALLKAIDQSESALLNQGRLSRELQDGLMSVRMVPFSSVAERLHRVVRQSAKELGKRASLQISGAQTELDRSVLERMSAPFEHLLRNALAHGIEPAALRRAQGKSEVGEIVIELRHDGNEAHIEVRDDGGGLDLDAIRRRARERGLIEADAQWSDRQLAELIFLPGFSTAADVTLAAGRGVGMDVVKNEVSALGGRIDLEFERGRGTRFLIRLPLALGVKRSLLMEVGKRIYALPVQIIEHVMTVKTELMHELYQTRVAQWQGNRYPFHYLPHLLGIAAVPAAARRSVSVLMLRSGAERLALQVDRIVGIQELVSKRLGAQLESLVGINGAAVLGTGQVVLFVNPVELAARATAQARAIAHAADAAAGQRRQRLVLVVDDSLTVRKVTGRLLNRAGYEVISAKDGVDAVNQLKSVTPDIMLVDIEMPRMDGFELTKHVRATSTLAAIPIIMVTSRDADKHRNYAFELGVNAFLGKPYQEEELLANIARFLEPAERARAA